MDDQGINQASGRIRFRRLRLALSVACGVVCAVVVILWWRSYHFYDSLAYKISTMAPQTCWCDGLLYVGYMKDVVTEEEGPLIVHTYRIVKMDRWQKEIEYKNTNALGFGGINNSAEWVMITPFWLPWVVSGVCSVVLWPGKIRRFQLRDLFVAVTIVAIVLGLAAYAARNN